MEKFYDFCGHLEEEWARISFVNTFLRGEECPACHIRLDLTTPLLVPPVSMRFAPYCEALGDRMGGGLGDYMGAVVITERMKCFLESLGVPVDFPEVEVLPTKARRLVPPLPLTQRLYLPMPRILAWTDEELSIKEENTGNCEKCGRQFWTYTNEVIRADTKLSMFRMIGARTYISESVYTALKKAGFTNINDLWSPGEIAD